MRRSLLSLVVFTGLTSIPLLAGCNGPAPGPDGKASQDKMVQLGMDLQKAQDENLHLKDQLKAVTEERDKLKSAAPQVAVSVSPAATLSPAAVTATPSAASPAPSQERTLDGKKASNSGCSLWTTKIAEYSNVDQLGPMIRLGSEEQERLHKIQETIKSSDQKIIVVWAKMTNDSSAQVPLGCSYHLGPFLVRGEEGTQVDCNGDGLFLTQHMEGGFPYESMTNSKQSVSGKICFITKSWLKPVSFFTQSDAHMGKGDLVTSLK